MAKDYYNILGVDRGASDEEIKKAYRKLAHQHHPDKSGGSEVRFKEINEAYQVLGNKEKREQYDRFGESFQQAGGNPFGGAQGFRWEDIAGNGGFQNVDFDIGDLFGDFFGGGRSGARSSAARKQRGSDIQSEIAVSFAEAAFGTTKKVELTRTARCLRCSGSGAEPGAGMKTCAHCDGKGSIRQIQNTILGQFATSAVCAHCHGSGQMPKEKCKECNGATTQRRTDAVTIKIPAGIDEGQTVRLTDDGNAGSHNASSGDLYLTVHVIVDQRFKRKGMDVLSEYDVSFSQAALGATINIPTLDGVVAVKVPAGTQSGTVLRLRGKGAVKLGSNSRGDHLLTITVQTPQKLSKKAKELFERLGEEGG